MSTPKPRKRIPRKVESEDEEEMPPIMGEEYMQEVLEDGEQ